MVLSVLTSCNEHAGTFLTPKISGRMECSCYNPGDKTLTQVRKCYPQNSNSRFFLGRTKTFRWTNGMQFWQPFRTCSSHCLIFFVQVTKKICLSRFLWKKIPTMHRNTNNIRFWFCWTLRLILSITAWFISFIRVSVDTFLDSVVFLKVKSSESFFVRILNDPKFQKR